VARNRQRARDRKRQADEAPDATDSTPASLEHTGAGDEVAATLAQGSGAVPPEDPDAAVNAFGASDQPPAARTDKQRGPRVWHFFKACWAELQRVQWPNRQQVGQATAVVLGFVVVAGAYLGLADAAAKKLVDLIL
jgi:preprotein translocase subunit SecE